MKNVKVKHLDSNSNTDDLKSKPKTDEIPDVTFGWNHVASTIDFFAFWSFLITNIIITIAMFTVAAS